MLNEFSTLWVTKEFTCVINVRKDNATPSGFLNKSR